jgi:hypothetical protein
MKRAALRRRPQRDPVTLEVAVEVIGRDHGQCIGERVVPDHVCRTLLTLDHVWWHAGGTKGRRAPSRVEHLVTMCLELNVGAPSAELREAERQHLRTLYPTHGTAMGCVCLRDFHIAAEEAA